MTGQQLLFAAQYTSCVSSGYHPMGAYYGPSVITLGLKGLKVTHSVIIHCETSFFKDLFYNQFLVLR